MKLTKCLIFKINNQKFAIRTSMVFNIVEKPRLIKAEYLKPYEKAKFSFRGMIIPLLDFRKILGLSSDKEIQSQSILIVELKINGYPELVGISIDEVIEVSDVDDILSYPYCSVTVGKECTLRETIIIKHGEPIIMIDTSKIISEKVFDQKTDKLLIAMAN